MGEARPAGMRADRQGSLAGTAIDALGCAVFWTENIS
jgi:hypothetical protein